jgi:hypothetical protein
MSAIVLDERYKLNNKTHLVGSLDNRDFYVIFNTSRPIDTSNVTIKASELLSFDTICVQVGEHKLSNATYVLGTGVTSAGIVEPLHINNDTGNFGALFTEYGSPSLTLTAQQNEQKKATETVGLEFGYYAYYGLSTNSIITADIIKSFRHDLQITATREIAWPKAVNQYCYYAVPQQLLSDTYTLRFVTPLGEGGFEELPDMVTVDSLNYRVFRSAHSLNTIVKVNAVIVEKPETT